MTSKQYAKTVVKNSIDETWNQLIEILGLTTGILNLPYEMTTANPSPDKLMKGMRLQTSGTAGTLRAAILSEFNTENYTLNIKVLRNENYDSKPHRNYTFSLFSTNDINETELRLSLEIFSGIIIKISQVKLADSILNKVENRM